MKTSLNLSIPKPCAEKWQNFRPTSDGGYCGSCSKVVVDFTRMSDEEIINLFKSKPAHTCGRFRADQLKTYVKWQPATIYPGLALLRAGMMSLLLLLMSKQTSAQDVTSKAKIETTQRLDEFAGTSIAPPTKHLVKGVVKDQDGYPLPGVNVYLKDRTEGVVTDSEGLFEFPRTLEEGEVLIFSFIGFESTTYVVPKSTDGITIDLKMTMDLEITLGEIAVNDVYTAKSRFSQWWSNFKNIF